MIIIGIEHCNGEIMDKPFIIEKTEKVKEYWLKGYLIYKIDIKNNKIEEIKYD